MQGVKRVVSHGGVVMPDIEETGPEDGPELAALVEELEDAVNHADVWYRRSRLAEDATWCQWEGQSDSGLKEASGEDDEIPFPWAGASDTRIRLTEEYVRKSCRVCDAAFRRGRWKFAGTESDDAGWAQRASTVLRWLIYSKMRPMAQRERKLALYWRTQLGVSFLLVDWEECAEYQMTELDLAGLLEAFGLGPLNDWLQQRGERAMDFLKRIELQGGSEPELRAYEELKNALDLALNPGREAELVRTLQILFPTVTRPKLRQAAREVRATGKTRLPQPYMAKSRPVWRALKPMRDGFVPANTTSLDEARWFAVRDYLSKSELLEKAGKPAEQGGWDADAVDYILKYGEGLDFTEAQEKEAVSDSKRYVTGRGTWESAGKEKEDFYEVFTWYYWGTDDYGVRGLYQTVGSASVHRARSSGRGQSLNPDFASSSRDSRNDPGASSVKIASNDPGNDPCVLSHGLATFEHGRLPVVEEVFFRDSELLLENVGLPYMLYTYQNEVKNQRDARIDHSSISILPPVRRALQDRNSLLTISPGSPLFEQVRGSTEFMRPPENRSLQSVELEDAVKQDAARIAGGMHGEIPAPEVQLHQQELADDYLDEMVELLSLTFQTAQQFLQPSTVARVSGGATQVFEVSAEEIRGSFDLRIVFDARELDTEFAMMKAKAAQELLSRDQVGSWDQHKANVDLMSLVDANWAEEWAKDPREAQQDEVDDELKNVSMIVGAGMEPPMRAEGQNAELRRQVMLSQVSGERANPEVVRALQENEQKRKIYENRLQHLQFVHEQKTERPNDGRRGAKPVLGDG
jgi:hypothetical protein